MMPEAQESLLALAQQGDQQALERLITPYRALLHALARRFYGSVLSGDELAQAGYLGLIEAVRRYDAGKGVRLITYAVPWILGEMKRALRAAACAPVSLDGESGEEEGQSLLDTLRGADGVNMEALDLRMAIAQLTQEEQSVLLLRFYQDKTQKETAAALSKSQAQISRIERHALDCLRTLLA